jgi:AbrB family looped-hinge helix DNA binding protein
MSYHAKITSKGQITLPAELRQHLKVRTGDTIEFYLDHMSRVFVRVRRDGVKEFLDALPKRKPDPRYPTDDDTIAAAVLARDARSRARKVRGR